MALLAVLSSDAGVAGTGAHGEEPREGAGRPHMHDRAHDAGLARRLWEMSEAAVAAVAAAVADTADATIGVGLTPPPAASSHSPVPSGRRPPAPHHHAPAAAESHAAGPARARVG